uniref:Uncharacterized protein n=1 Tax=Arundo donax TaxID=35708 RepID=A0A0A8Z921_ARUDO
MTIIMPNNQSPCKRYSLSSISTCLFQINSVLLQHNQQLLFFLLYRRGETEELRKVLTDDFRTI